MLKTNLNQAENQHVTLASLSRYLLGGTLLVLCTHAFASSEPKSETTDSVFAWGMWEYNIAPAAGDLQNQNSSPLNPRSAKVVLRTNSNAAIAPNGTAELTPNIRPSAPPAPVTSPAPIAPPAPIIITQAPPPPIVVPTIPAPPAATPPTTVTPPPAPNIGTSPGATPISGTPLNLGF